MYAKPNAIKVNMISLSSGLRNSLIKTLEGSIAVKSAKIKIKVKI